MENKTPAIIEYDSWINSPLSVAKYYGGININGKEYRLMDSEEPADEGMWKPDLVRKDWCSLFKKLRRGVEKYVEQGLTPSQVRKLLKQQDNA